MNEIFELLDKLSEHVCEASKKSAEERNKGGLLLRRSAYYDGQLATWDMMARLLDTLRVFYRDKQAKAAAAPAARPIPEERDFRAYE